MNLIKQSLRSIVLATSLCVLIAAAHAHGSSKPEHGGKVEMSGETLLELVVRPEGVSLYVKDDDDEVPSSGLTARLLVADKAGKTEVPMLPAAGNKFEARGLKVVSGSKVGVTLVDKKTQAKMSATFSID